MGLTNQMYMTKKIKSVKAWVIIDRNELEINLPLRAYASKKSASFHHSLEQYGLYNNEKAIRVLITPIKK